MRDGREREAMRLAQEFWPLRFRMQGKLIPLDRAIAQARTIEGPVIFTDAADATSSGATGDSNVIIEGAARGRLPEARARADRRSAGCAPPRTRPASAPPIEVALGGVIDPGAFHADAGHGARCKLLSDGRCAAGDDEDRALDAGPTAVLTFDNFTVVVFSRSVSLFDRAMYYRQRPRPGRLRPDRRQVAAHRAPHVRRLGARRTSTSTRPARPRPT